MLNRNTTLYGILALVLSNPVYAALDCTSHPTCESLGYLKSDTANCADGGYLSCPYDTSYKKCVQVITYANDPCYGFSLTSCPDNASCYKCETETATMYTFNACDENHCLVPLSVDTVSCKKACDGNIYRYAQQIEGAEMTGECTGYLSSGATTCLGNSETTRWSGFTCKEGYTLNSAGTGCELACTYADEAACESANANADCTDVNGCYEPTGCKTNFCLSESACYQVCDPSTYKYFTGSSSLPTNASPDTSSSSCLGHTGASAGSCSGQSLTRYTDFVCNSGFCKANNQCNQVCDPSTYKYYTGSSSLPSNASPDTYSSSCLGYTGTSAGSCSGQSLTRYAKFACNSGYYKNSAGTGCEACTYKNKDECQDINYNSVCTPNSHTGCYEATSCEDEYNKITTCAYGREPVTDPNKCGKCQCPSHTQWITDETTSSGTQEMPSCKPCGATYKSAQYYEDEAAYKQCIYYCDTMKPTWCKGDQQCTQYSTCINRCTPPSETVVNC